MKKCCAILLLTAIFLSTSSIKAQSADEQIGSLINDGDYLELNRQYPLFKDSVSPLLRTFTEAMLDVTFNRPEEAAITINKLISNYQQDIGFENTSNMLLVLTKQQLILGKYATAADMLHNFLYQLTDADIPAEVLAPHRTQYEIAESLRKFPKSELIRPFGDTEVDIEIKQVGSRGSLMYVPVKINGKHSSFIFDTGADAQAFVSKRFADEYGIRIISDSIVTPGIVTSSFSQVGVADQIEIGNIIYRNVRFIVGHDSQIKPKGIIDTPDSLDFLLDAVLGREFMDAVGEIQIFPHKGKIVFPEKHTPLPVFGSNLMNNVGQPYLEAYSNNERLLFHLDTGNSSYDLSNRYYNTHQDYVQAVGKKDNIGLGGFGGAKMMDVYTLPTFPLQVGNKRFNLEDIIVQTEATNIGSRSGVLGMGFINLFDKVTINFKDMFITVD